MPQFNPTDQQLQKAFVFQADRHCVHLTDPIAAGSPDDLGPDAVMYRVLCTLLRDRPSVAARRSTAYRRLRACNPMAIQAWPDQVSGELIVLSDSPEEAALYVHREVTQQGAQPVFLGVWRLDTSEPVLTVVPSGEEWVQLLACVAHQSA